VTEWIEDQYQSALKQVERLPEGLQRSTYMGAQGTKRGRKPLPEGEGKRAPLSMRTTQSLRVKLELAAAQSGRSLAQEVEHRLEQSFIHDALGDLEARVKRLAEDVL
jgi:predicted HicB family RNase H-like nuclease